MKKKKKYYLSIALFVICILYTIFVKIVDVSSIGPEYSKVGFSTMNKAFHDMFTYSEGWYKITKYLGYLPFLLVAYYGIIGFLQWIKRKDFFKIDKPIIALGIFYIMVWATYFFFEKIIINYRPVLMDGVLEASYPSSHTMLAICVCSSSLFISKYYIQKETLRQIVDISTWVVMLVLVIGRAISGVHWLSDIIGGILISGLLISLFYDSIKNMKVKKIK